MSHFQREGTGTGPREKGVSGEERDERKEAQEVPGNGCK